MKIKDIPMTERPRERLIDYGVDKLSNEELIAIILNHGYKMVSAKELAIKILSLVDKPYLLSSISLNKLMAIKGIGFKKAATLLATIELGKRIYYKKETLSNNKIVSAEYIYNYFLSLKEERQEHFYVLYLDQAKRIIKEKLLFIGTVNFSVVHPREIFKEAYLNSASGIICIHNHPSGEVNPSKEDIELTNRLIEAGNLLGIKLIDHIIIGNSYYSFYENKLI